MFKRVALILSIVSGFTLFAQTTGDFNTKIDITYKTKSVQKINTENAEFSPVLFGGSLVFVSDREHDLSRMGEARWKKKKHLNLYKSKFTSPKDDSVVFSKTEAFDKALLDGFHGGPIGFHPNGKFAIITKVESTLRTNKPQLYLLKYENNKWSKPVRVSFCGNNFSYGHAQFSSDGNTVYFSSDQVGTLGGKDIFSSSFVNGILGSPMNLGDSVNTAADEMYPFAFDNKLYFSSNKAGGLGGLDVYKSEIKEGKFKSSSNLGATLNTSGDDFSFYLTPTGKNGFVASNAKGLGSDDIFFFTVTETATVVSKNIVGKFTYAKIEEGVPSGLQLQLIDEAGNVVQTTTTDADGNFKFTNLPADQDFTIKVLEVNPDLVLHIYNKEGKEYAVLMSNSKGSFVYKKLDNNEVGTLAFMEIEDTDLNGVKTGKINGQFVHEKLNGGPLGGMNVMLEDEAGKVYARTQTDKNGNFGFSKLPLDQNFFISTDSKYDDLKLLLYNNKDEVIAELKRRGQNPFLFRRLDGKLDNTLTMLEDQDVKLFPDKYTNVSGKFKLEKINGTPKELDFMVMDEAGNVIGKGRTDKNGNFILTGLPPSDTYVFQLEGSEAGLDSKGYKLQMLDRFGQEIQTISSNEAGLYVFDRKPKTAPVFSAGTVVIYFEKDKYEVDGQAGKELKALVDQMKADPSLLLKIDAHTDASANDEHNNQLSMRRMLSARQYFVKNGIATKRIKGMYHGEKKLVNNCLNAEDCSDEQNRMNRRCELVLVKP